MRILTKLILLSGILFSVHIFAITLTSNLPSSANIMPNCQFLGENIALAFGSYDPIVSNISSNKDATTSFRMRCIKGTTATIAINAGQNAIGDNRRMRGTTNDYLNYQLYTSANMTTPWTSSSTVSYTAQNPQPQTFSIYGRIPAGQDVSSGTYSDIVTLAVTF